MRLFTACTSSLAVRGVDARSDDEEGKEVWEHVSIVNGLMLCPRATEGSSLKSFFRSHDGSAGVDCSGGRPVPSFSFVVLSVVPFLRNQVADMGKCAGSTSRQSIFLSNKVEWNEKESVVIHTQLEFTVPQQDSVSPLSALRLVYHCTPFSLLSSKFNSPSFGHFSFCRATPHFFAASPETRMPFLRWYNGRWATETVESILRAFFTKPSSGAKVVLFGEYHQQPAVISGFVDLLKAASRNESVQNHKKFVVWEHFSLRDKSALELFNDGGSFDDLQQEYANNSEEGFDLHFYREPLEKGR